MEGVTPKLRRNTINNQYGTSCSLLHIFQPDGAKPRYLSTVAGASTDDGNEPSKKMKQDTKKEKKKPVVCIVMGMAGSGKTTLLQRLNLYTTEKGIKSYFINLDPAVKQVRLSVCVWRGVVSCCAVGASSTRTRVCLAEPKSCLFRFACFAFFRPATPAPPPPPWYFQASANIYFIVWLLIVYNSSTSIITDTSNAFLLSFLYNNRVFVCPAFCFLRNFNYPRASAPMIDFK